MNQTYYFAIEYMDSFVRSKSIKIKLGTNKSHCIMYHLTKPKA